MPRKRKKVDSKVNAATPRMHGAFDATKEAITGSGRVAGHVLDETREFWQRRTSRTLTREDAREIIHNVSGFFALLREWKVAEATTLKSDEPMKADLTGLAAPRFSTANDRRSPNL